ncbi:MAG: hypothetical protein H6739_09680 [Alphaproteobacteria bacterium]|nr:hypothetical protein [Alphaproteobacteria bacterium]
MRLLLGMMLGLLLIPAPALAAPDGEPAPPQASTVPDPQVAHRIGNKDKKAEQEQQMTDAEKEAEKRRKDRASRVVVLKWPQTETDYMDETLRRNVRSRIDRADALFFPSVDLYQNGRKVPDKTVIPANQPAMVPDSNLDAIVAETNRVSAIPWDALTPAEWGLEGNKLLRLVDTVWFVEKVEQREPLFLLYSQIGNAAENQNNPAPPFYEAIGGQFVNYYFYLCATLALQDPSLMSKLTNQDLNGAVTFYLQQLQQGTYPMFPLDFELENEFDLDQFDKEYEVLLNGLPVEIDYEAQVIVPLGRHDIYLKRKDTGHGLSEKLVVDKLEEKAYFVRDVARKKMGIEFIDQLFKHPNECTPELDGDILNYLAIYAKLHSQAEIYIAVPRYGNPNKVWIWRYDRSTATLQLVGGGNDGFPVRFAAVGSVGILYNWATFSVDDEISESDVQGVLETSAQGELQDRLDANPEAGTLPFSLELRGHYNRLMIAAGIEGGYNLASEGKYVERYHTPVHGGDFDNDLITIQAQDRQETERTDENGDPVLDENGDPVPGPDLYSGPEALHFSRFNRYIYGAVGVGLGRDASLGFGPRLALKVGWTNLPYAIQTTGHFGWTIEGENLISALPSTNRVRPLLDIDARAGVAISLPGSIQSDLAQSYDSEKIVAPVFGLTAGIGTTF